MKEIIILLPNNELGREKGFILWTGNRPLDKPIVFIIFHFPKTHLFILIFPNVEEGENPILYFPFSPSNGLINDDANIGRKASKDMQEFI